MTQTDPQLIQIDSKPFAITLEPGSRVIAKGLESIWISCGSVWVMPGLR